MNYLKRVLVVVGENERDPIALDYAELLADPNGAHFTVADVKAHLEAYAKALSDIIEKEELRALILKQRKDQLHQCVQRHNALMWRSADIKVLDGVPFIEIIKEAVQGGYDLIVKVADGDKSQRERQFGSTDMHLMRKSPVPIWIVNASRPSPPTNVLAALDVLSEAEGTVMFNRRILALASAVAERAGADLHALSVWQLFGEETMRHSPFLKVDETQVQKMLNATEEQVAGSLNALSEWLANTLHVGNPPTIHKVKGAARNVIPTFVEQQNVDLIVMGTVGRTGIPGLFIGNTAESVLGNVDCSVLTIKPDGFLTPVADG